MTAGVPYPPNPPENPPHPFIPGSPGWLAYERGRAAADSWWRSRLVSDETVEAVAKVIAGPAKCCCDDDWRLPPSRVCPVHGEGSWPYQHHYAKARAALAALLPVPDPETPRGEWRVLDGGNVVCRHAGYDNAWAEGQCRALVEQFPDEQFRIERRAEGGEWEPYCPADTPMGSCGPRCGDARCEAVAAADRDTPDQETDT